MILEFLTLFGALGLFLYGMHMWSNNMQKLFGDNLRKLLSWMTSPKKTRQVASGFLFTLIVLFSTTTTLMAISSVDAGLLSLAQAAGVIMGANIGTTFTSWFISIFGFSLNIKYFCFLVVLAGFVLTMIKKNRMKLIGDSIIGIGLVLLGLQYVQLSLTNLYEIQALNGILTAMSSWGFASVLLFFLTGIVISYIFQSSGATVAMLLVLLSVGWIRFDMAAAVVLGANVGTTINSTLAAKKGNILARRAAIIRLMFNGTGAVLALVFFNPFVHFTGWIISIFGQGNPADAAFYANASSTLPALFGICLFHTLFNALCTLILIRFTESLEKIATKLIAADPTDASRMKFINEALVGTPSIAIVQALKETVNYGKVCYDGFKYIEKAIDATERDEFEQYKIKLSEYETITDKIEYNIAGFLNKLNSKEQLNDNEAKAIKRLYRVISEMESLGDSADNIGRVLGRERIHNMKFDEHAKSGMKELLAVTDKAYNVMIVNLQKALDCELFDIQNAYDVEDEINKTRDRLRDEAIGQIKEHKGNYQSTNYFLDVISQLEAMGDFMINISQSLIKGI